MAIKRIQPGPGQESVWNYPRPPRMEGSAARFKVVVDGWITSKDRRSFQS